MARIGAVIEPHRRDSRFHVALILAVVTGILLVGSHLFYLPLHQVYWGMYARVKPMVSGNSFIDASVPSGPTSTSSEPHAHASATALKRSIQTAASLSPPLSNPASYHPSNHTNFVSCCAAIDQLDPGASPLPKITTHNINTSGVPEVQGGLLQMMPTVEEEDWWLVPPQEHTWVLEGFDNSTIGAPSLTK